MARPEALNNYPRTILASTPTPFHKLANISADMDCDIYCKRDDLTGFAFGGNKVRKMEYLIAEAVEKKADTIVTVGAYQSNFCRVTAAAGMYSGLDVYLVLGGSKTPSMTGNYMLINRLGAKLHTVKSDSWEDWEAGRRDLAEELRRKEKTVYEMPIGGSTPPGALGYVDAFLEMHEDFKRLNLKPTHLFFASSSGGTHAGLLIGKWLTGWEGRLIGIGTAKTGGKLTKEIASLAKETAAICGSPYNESDIIVDDAYTGKAYGIPTTEAEAAIGYFARREGIFLDRVYTGKAAAGLLNYVKEGKAGKEGPVVFLHTGGNIELFA